jgi:hypothetical protein
METKADEAIAQSVADTAAGTKGPYPGAKFSSHHLSRWQQGANEPDNAWVAKHVSLVISCIIHAKHSRDNTDCTC